MAAISSELTSRAQAALHISKIEKKWMLPIPGWIADVLVRSNPLSRVYINAELIVYGWAFDGPFVWPMGCV